MLFRSLLILFLTLGFSSYAYAQSSFYTYMERCETLRPQIEAILVEEGLPEYFFFLALAESGCDPSNVSHRGAKGLYQIMPYTFKVYSIGICDEKKPCSEEKILDPIISTRVAAKYLKSLYTRFHRDVNWTIAAYNAGGTNLRKKTGYVKGMKFSIVKRTYPEAYLLARKVENFSKISYPKK